MAKKVADHLLAAGVLGQDQYTATIEYMSRTGERSEEAILELGLLAEADMLKALASLYKTNFVSTERLAKADVPKATLDMIPRRFAESALLFPVIFDPKSNVLSVVTPDPENLEALREVQLTSGAHHVKAFVARPAAVKAAIQKMYGGDIHAFALLDRQAHAQFHQMLDVYERNLVSDESMATALAKENTGKKERVVSEEQMARASMIGSVPKLAAAHSSDAYLELLNVLVSLLEQSRADLRGHSGHVARLCRQMAERMSLDGASTAALVAAAYVHDLGKMGQFHLTALNCSEYDGHKRAAQKGSSTPGRLLEPVQMNGETIDAVGHMYERYDGRGFPEAMTGKDIPLAARILAICDTYADLTHNARNPFRKLLTSEEACAVLAKYKGTIYDPNLVDLFRHAVMGEDIRARLLQNRYSALIVDQDPEETTVLELRLIEQGFVVKTARTADAALKALAGGDADIVVSELDLGSGDGMRLLAESRKQPWGKDLPWVVYTRRQERAAAQQALALGVLDFVAKPAKADVLVAKLKAMLDQRASPRATRGVSGSLREMSLPDIVQVLFNGKKTGNLKIRARGESGEIHVQDGEVVNALWGALRGEAAFYAMLKFVDGEFGLDPTFKPTTREINQRVEALLLEGMRRLDEGIADG
jgi:response regulator RpfG family c-di-GMP phosphodiesterase